MANNGKRIRGRSRIIETTSALMLVLSLQSIPAVGHAQHVAVAPPNRSYDTRRVTVNVDQAPLTVVLQLIARQAGLVPVFTEEMLPTKTRVTLHVHGVGVLDAFAQALQGTGLIANVYGNVNVAIVRSGDLPTVTGIVIGTITDGDTKRPIRGANVGLDGTDRVSETAEDGSYRLVNVSAGAHTIIVKRIGYRHASRTITVQDDQTMTLNVALDPSATALDQVVVTGMVIPTELKAVPNAMTVITARQIEERGITKIDQLFRGDVPGMFASNQGSYALLDEVAMTSRGVTSFSPNDPRAGTFAAYSNPVKTYVDGVELADPKYLSQIDPKSIERIEILTGPQASTIYGSNAINGVMQIFTKRGTTPRPQVTLNLLSGWVENNFSRARTPQHDYSAQVNGAEGRISYNAGGSWNYVGPWTPAKQSARTGGFGGARFELPTSVGRVTTDVTLRRSVTQSLQRGNQSQAQTGYRETGWYTNVSSSGLAQPTTRTLTGQTLGLTLSYTLASWWSHEVSAGSDVLDAETRVTAPGYLTRVDTALLLSQSHTDRRALRYATTARLPLTALSELTVIAGADAWQNLYSSLSASPQTLTGVLTNVTSITRQPGHNAGGFLQSQVGFKDHVFLTYGFRAEWNPNYGKDAEPNYSPRYGIAYTQDMQTPLGPATIKVRGSYGRSTRPPAPQLKSAQTIADIYGSSWSSSAQYFLPYYGDNFDYYLANPALGPEHQQGGEGGLELYLGTRGSLVVTRYNQTVNGLIASPTVDSVRTLVPCDAFSPSCFFTSVDAQGYGYYRQFQYLNIGSIRNQGWELQGDTHIGSFTTHGTYTWTKSRAMGVSPQYRSSFPANGFREYQPGATFQYLPEHTWAAGVTYARATFSIGLNMTGTGRVMIFNDDFFVRYLFSSIRLPQNRINISNTGGYVSFNQPYVLADLSVSRRFSSWVDGVLQVQNLADRYINDYYAVYASIGRQTKLGVRIH